VIPTFFVLVKLFRKKSPQKYGKSLIHRLRTAAAIAKPYLRCGEQKTRAARILPAVAVVSTIFAVVQAIYARLERRASFRTHKGRSNTFNPRIVLSENRFRFSGR
jgi:peptidoglycan/LPS O-acetylase OafA/YrhL